MFLEDLGILFKNDPTFDFIFNNVPSGLFKKIVKLRKKRLETKPPSLGDLL